MRTRILKYLGVLVLLAAIVYAQEPERFNNRPVEVVNDRIYLGTSVEFQMEGTTGDAFEMKFVVDPTEDIIYEWPAANATTTGQQLAATTGGTLSWAAAGSLEAYKHIEGRLDPTAALAAIRRVPVYRFHYLDDKQAVTTGDTKTEYAGVLANDAPWAMHHDGKILNPVNTFGYAAAAIQAQQAQIEALQAEIARLKRGQR